MREHVCVWNNRNTHKLTKKTQMMYYMYMHVSTLNPPITTVSRDCSDSQKFWSGHMTGESQPSCSLDSRGSLSAASMAHKNKRTAKTTGFKGHWIRGITLSCHAFSLVLEASPAFMAFTHDMMLDGSRSV